MVLWALMVSAVLLSIERSAYLWIWHNPGSFSAVCNKQVVAALGEPIDVLQKLFYLFKVIQLSVFFGWCMLFGDTLMPLPTGTALSMICGVALIMTGMFLNFSVFLRLGKTGVFYGNKLGYDTPWHNGFPFSVFKHPQYLGTAIAIWGFFLLMRFPHGDWIALPALSTFYYFIGAHYEQ